MAWRLRFNMTSPDAAVEEAAALLARAITMLLTRQSSPSADEWLRPAQAAEILGMSAKSLTRRWRRLPFCLPLPEGMRGYRVSRRALERYMATTGRRS